MKEKDKLKVVGVCGVLAILCLVALVLCSCARFSDNLKQIHTAVSATTTAANKAFHAACKADLVECKAAGVKTWRDCPAYVECDQGRADVNAAVDAIEEGLLLLDKAHKKAVEEGWVK